MTWSGVAAGIPAFNTKGNVNMAASFEEFTPEHDFLICFDSDGTVMDTMAVKHIRCLGPALVEEWDLNAWEGPILQLWNQINLYQITRGINRFKALALALRAIHEAYTPIDGLPELEAWVSSGDALSGDALQRMTMKPCNSIFHKALHWTEIVNKKISELPLSDKKPFPGAVPGLEAASEFADIAVISTANRVALMEEWGEYGLLNFANVILAQDSGNKPHCIKALLDKGYQADHVLMVGDALGDLEAAKENHIYFYPMLCRHEKESWDELWDVGYTKFITSCYAHYEEARLKKFFQNLDAE